MFTIFHNHLNRQRPFRSLIFFIKVLSISMFAEPYVFDQNLYGNEHLIGDEVELSAQTKHFDAKRSLLIAKGSVTIRYQDILLTADEVELNIKTMAFHATGQVKIVQDKNKFVSEGTGVSGNLKTGEFDIHNYWGTLKQWYIRGKTAKRYRDGRIEIKEAVVSSCDHVIHKKLAHWQINARRLVYTKEGEFSAFSVRYKLYGLPILYLPVLKGKQRHDHSLGLSAQTGYRKKWGPFLRLANDWLINDMLKTTFILWYRAKRGLALGNETTLQTERSMSHLLLYYLHDREPPANYQENDQDYYNRFLSGERRYRLTLKHRFNFSDRLVFRLHTDYLSDSELIREFFPDELHGFSQISNGIDLNYQGDHFDLLLRYHPRLNDFASIVERLPELNLTLPRRMLGNSSVYYQGESSLAQLRLRWRDYDLSRRERLTELSDYAAFRLDSLHMFYRPIQKNAWTFTPRIGTRLSYYDRSSKNKLSPELWQANIAYDHPGASRTDTRTVYNYDDQGGDQLRMAFELGFELNASYYHRWSGEKSKGLQHVLSPYLNYTFIPEPNVESDQLYFFDSVDRISKSNFIRLGLEQYWQRKDQKNPNRLHTFAHINSYIDWHFKREEGRRQQRDFSTRLEFSPWDHFSLWTNALTNLDRPRLDLFSCGIQVGKADRLHSSITYTKIENYLSRVPYSMGSHHDEWISSGRFPLDFADKDQLRWKFSYPINSSTRFNCHYFFDLANDSLVRQNYELSRRIHCFNLTFLVQKTEYDTGIYVSISLL